MPRTARFHLDESSDPKIALGLRLHGIDITIAAEVGLLAAQDQYHFDFAIAQNRAIITQDADFLRFAASGQPHWGIFYYAPQSRSIGKVISVVCAYWELFDGCELCDQIHYV